MLTIWEVFQDSVSSLKMSIIWQTECQILATTVQTFQIKRFFFVTKRLSLEVETRQKVDLP